MLSKSWIAFGFYGGLNIGQSSYKLEFQTGNMKASVIDFEF